MKGEFAILSQEGESISPYKINSVGRIVGESRDKRCWWIEWSDAKGRKCYHKSFLEILTPEAKRYYFIRREKFRHAHL